MTVYTGSPGPVELHGLRLEVAAMSEQGPRTENQDAYDIDGFASSGLVALADGMGGERGGRMAADVALRALGDAAPIRTIDEARRAVRRSDSAVVDAAQENPAEHGGMGCALGMLALSDSRGDGTGWVAAHVGDVRIISRSPDGLVRLETRDHTPAFARWEAGEISLDEIPDTTGANRLQRAVGRGGEPDVGWIPARAGWSWLIISDGVYKVMRLDELGRLMALQPAGAVCDAIREKVEERGPEDNFTAVFVRALGPAASLDPDLTQPMPQPTRGAEPTAARRSAGATIAIVLALLALAASGFAAWTAVQLGRDDSAATEIDRLRGRVDSLAVEIRAATEPFGPDTTSRDTVPAPRSGGTP